MPYNFVADSFHTKKLCSRLSSSEVRFFTEIGRIAFLRHPLGDLGATYDDHLKLSCYGWGAKTDNRAKIADFAPTRSLWSKISGRRGRPHQSFLHG